MAKAGGEKRCWAATLAGAGEKLANCAGRLRKQLPTGDTKRKIAPTHEGEGKKQLKAHRKENGTRRNGENIEEKTEEAEGKRRKIISLEYRNIN